MQYHERRHSYRNRDNILGQEEITARSRNHWIIGEEVAGEFREFNNMPHFEGSKIGKEYAQKIARSIKQRFSGNWEARYFEKGERYLRLQEIGPDVFAYVFQLSWFR